MNVLFLQPVLGPSDFDRILANPKLDGAIVSAIVTDLDGRTLYEHNSALHVIPASNQKLLSNAFALWELGPDYRPKTLFWKMPSRIVIDAPGDPTMTYDDLIQARRKLGIDGRFPVCVREAYAPEIPDSWEIDDLPNRYSAPVAAFTFDQGAFALWSKRGKASLVPEAFGVKVKISPAPGDPVVIYDPIKRKLEISGTLPKADKELETLALPRPDEAAASIFGDRFLPTSETPQATPDLVVTGKSTIEMVGACLPPSDNNIAENLLLMGARKEGDLGASPYAVARGRLQNFLVRVVGVNREDVHPFDGSGLSRHNYVTTRAIAKLLCWANSQPTGVAWRGAFAQPGTGTLGNRLKGLVFQAKTGSLDMVASLSGYLTMASGKTVVVSVILNEYACSAGAARAVADEFVKAVAAD
jgi:D-alanyl-D-alanine carboxypeptidase/D-alanyl-D-alanine-endopeptidase (penicillin-binding protein 4)